MSALRSLAPFRSLPFKPTLHPSYLSRFHSTSPPHPQINTVSDAEITKFASFSHEWWSPRGPMQLLHLMNPLRASYVREAVELTELTGSETSRGTGPLKGIRVLDVGCGAGLMSEALARMGATVTGIDAAKENIHVAKEHARLDPRLTVFEGTSQPIVDSKWKDGSIDYRHASAESLLESGLREQFDMVCSFEVIEHVDNPTDFLKVCGELVKPNGLLFLSTIARTPLSYLISVYAAERLLGLVPPGTHDPSKFINPSELVDAVYDLEGRWTVRDVSGVWFNPLLGKWERVSKSLGDVGTSNNYFLWAQKGRQVRPVPDSMA